MFALIDVIMEKQKIWNTLTDFLPSRFMRIEELRIMNARFIKASVRIPEGNEKRAERRMRKASEELLLRGARFYITGSACPEANVLITGLLPLSPLPLYRHFAANITAMSARSIGLNPMSTTAVIISDKCGADVIRAASGLCVRFRNIALCCKYGDNGLGEFLLREYGVPVLARPPGEGERIELYFDRPEHVVPPGAMCFFEGGREDIVFGTELESPVPGYDGGSMICALWKCGALSDEKVSRLIDGGFCHNRA